MSLFVEFESYVRAEYNVLYRCIKFITPEGVNRKDNFCSYWKSCLHHTFNRSYNGTRISRLWPHSCIRIYLRERQLAL